MDPNASKKGMFNKLNKAQALQRLEAETFNRKTVSFYRYVILNDPHQLRDELYEQWRKLGVLGRVYLAEEGINAQLSVPQHNWEAFVYHLNGYVYFADIPFKVAVEDDGKSFLKLTIKVRKQIVADGLKNHEYDVTNVGKHLSAKQWNEAMSKGATVVDMRNHYESEIGRFQDAICPEVETFKEELPKVKQLLKGKEEEPILLYCTGGIRCEKASAYLKHNGFQDVNQLHGGIIDYVRQLEQDESIANKFEGKNFVFDERLSERISENIISNCHQCGVPADSHINCKNVNCNLLFIQCEKCRKAHKGCCSHECVSISQMPEQEQAELRAGAGNLKRYHNHSKVDLSKTFKKNE
tara:strand:- start:2457 stop:3515 length:1059 start_codon:yes stop_codon:yes gene_type:complete